MQVQSAEGVQVVDGEVGVLEATEQSQVQPEPEQKYRLAVGAGRRVRGSANEPRPPNIIDGGGRREGEDVAEARVPDEGKRGDDQPRQSELPGPDPGQSPVYEPRYRQED